MPDGNTATELDQWFQGRGYLLAFEHDGDVVRAVVMYANVVAGAALAIGEGATRDAAAQAAFGAFQAALEPVISVASMPYETTKTIGPAVETDTAGRITPGKAARITPAVETDTAGRFTPQPPGLTTLSPELVRRLGGMHAHVAALPNSDGTWRWYLASADTHEILQSGVADDLDDAKLAAIIDAFPPSEEDEARGDRRWDH